MKALVKELFPKTIAAKLVRDKASVTQDEVDEFVVASRNCYEKHQSQYSEIMDLKRRLRIAEQEIQFLSVESK